MNSDKRDRPTIARGEGARGAGIEGSAGGRDDKTRVRLPSVGRDAGPAEPRRPGPAGGGRTVRMQAVPARFGWLIVKSGARVGQVYRLNPETTDLGRSAQNDILVDDDRVSEAHCRIRVDEQGQFVVWDLASTNGTFVNGERIMAATPVVENDEVRLGQTVLVLKTLDLET
jgi:hypothetical protein